MIAVCNILRDCCLNILCDPGRLVHPIHTEGCRPVPKVNGMNSHTNTYTTKEYLLQQYNITRKRNRQELV